MRGLNFSTGINKPPKYRSLAEQVGILGQDGKIAARYSFGDTSSLYLDDQAVGGNVSADAETVGLVLDKAQIGGKTASAFIAGQSNVVTNGGFDADSDWTKGTGWSISGGVATHSGATIGNLSQTALTVGKTYKITMTVTGGNVNVFAGSGNFVTNVTGSVNLILEAVTNGSIFIQCATDGVAVDDVSYCEIPGLHFLQSDTAKEPTFKIRTNGSATYNALNSSGVDELLTSTPSMYAQGGMVMVFGVSGAAQSDKIIFAESSSASVTQLYMLGTGITDTGALKLFIRNDANTTLLLVESTVDIADGSPHVVTVIDTGSSYEFRVDGAAAGSGSYTRSGTLTLNVANMLALKRTTESNWFAGDLISPIFADPTVVSAAEIRTMEAYIAQLMGVTLS